MATCPLLWFPIYAMEMLSDADFLAWTPAERGCWLTLTARCWADGSIPEDPERMAKLCGCDAREMPKYWSAIASKFSPHDILGRLKSNRIEVERQLAITKADTIRGRAQSGAAARWMKNTGGNAGAMPEQCSSNAQAMPKQEPPAFPPAPAEVPDDKSSEVPVKPKKKAKPRGRDFGIDALKMPPDVQEAFDKMWKDYPAKGWDFRTKKDQPRRVNYAEAAKRFAEIIQFSDVRHDDGTPITADELADSTRAFLAEKWKEAKQQGLPSPCIPCIANYFSSCEGEKHHWKESLLKFFDAIPPVTP